MRNPFRKGICFLVLAAFLFAPGQGFPDDEASHGWKVASPGLWSGLPELRAGYSDNGISLEMTLRPGTGVTCSRTGRWTADNAVLQFSTDTINPGGNEYRVGETYFPASATFVFGKDSQRLGVKGRIWLFFRELRHGFRPSGIRLTYAWGNRLPVGSMYRLWEEETVFILAGPEEIGKNISTGRRLSEDFQAAYGRPPKGPVTEVLVEARRPSRETGPAHTAITLRYPAE
jgi:hypothetical protein